MSALKDLHRRLYSHNNEDLIKREVSPDAYGNEDQANEEEIKKEILDQNIKGKNKENQIYFKEEMIDNEPEIEKIDSVGTVLSRLNQNKFRIAGIFIVSILAVIGIVAGYVKFKQFSFGQENVKIKFEGTDGIKNGTEFDYKIIIDNNNRISLKNTQIIIEYPEELNPVLLSHTKIASKNSLVINTGDFKPREIKEYQLKFGVFSPRESQVYLKTDFRYEPSNFSSVFNKLDNHTINLKGSVIDFSLVSQQEVTNGELLTTIGILKNNTAKDYTDLILEITPSDGFSFGEIGLEKIEGVGNRFKIANLAANSQLEIKISGSFTGPVDSIKSLMGTIGFLSDDGEFNKISLAEENVKIIPSRINIDQEIFEGVDSATQVTYLGEILRYKINFKNNSTNPLEDLILKETIKTNLLEVASVRVDSGHFDQESNEITWKASDVPALKKLNPGESGSVSFDFQLKESFSPDQKNTNQTVVTQARISSLNVNTSLLSNKEIFSENREVKVGTNLDILVSGQYGGGAFKNYGPIPIKTGEETTFTLKVALKNNFNKIDKPILTISLPSGIIWKNSFQRSSGNVSFNERTNELKWELNAINAQIGYEYPTEELLFQIGIKPQANQDPALINSIVLKGFENFVEKEITKNLKEFKITQISDYDF